MSKHVQEQGCELPQVGCPEAELVRVLPPGHDPDGGGDPHPPGLYPQLREGDATVQSTSL